MAYAGTNAGITPNTSNDNWTLVAGSSEMGFVKYLSGTGEATSSTAMRTRVARSTGGTTASTATAAKTRPHQPAPSLDFVTGWSSQPTLATESLFYASWNCNGGGFRIMLAGADQLVIPPSANLSCRNAVGTGTSSYEVHWEE